MPFISVLGAFSRFISFLDQEVLVLDGDSLEAP